MEPTYNVPGFTPLVDRHAGSKPLKCFRTARHLPCLSNCEYVRPTLNVPLKQWEPGGGYRLLNLAPPEADSDSLFLVAAFSGGGVRASALGYGVLQELARQEITWQGRSACWTNSMSSLHCQAVPFLDRLVRTASDLILHDAEFQRLMSDIQEK